MASPEIRRHVLERDQCCQFPSSGPARKDGEIILCGENRPKQLLAHAIWPEKWIWLELLRQKELLRIESQELNLIISAVLAGSEVKGGWENNILDYFDLLKLINDPLNYICLCKRHHRLIYQSFWDDFLEFNNNFSAIAKEIKHLSIAGYQYWDTSYDQYFAGRAEQNKHQHTQRQLLNKPHPYERTIKLAKKPTLKAPRQDQLF